MTHPPVSDQPATPPQPDQPGQPSQPDQPSQPVDHQGPGWMPAIMAGTVLMGIIGFVVCAFSTWLLFQKRTELAIRTLRGSYITEIQQSHLDPISKAAVVGEIENLAADLERGKYENWQAAGIMQRLQRLPVIQWGQLQAVAASLETAGGDQVDQDLRQISRLQRAVELGMVTSFDFEDVLEPVRREDTSEPSGYRLAQPIKRSVAKEVVHRARLLAERSDVPDSDFEVRIEAIVRREIERGASEGGY